MIALQDRFHRLNELTVLELKKKKNQSLPRYLFLYHSTKCQTVIPGVVWCVVVSQGGGWTVRTGSSMQGGLQLHVEPGGVAGAPQLPDGLLPPGGGQQQL